MRMKMCFHVFTYLKGHQQMRRKCGVKRDMKRKRREWMTKKLYFFVHAKIFKPPAPRPDDDFGWWCETRDFSEGWKFLSIGWRGCEGGKLCIYFYYPTREKIFLYHNTHDLPTPVSFFLSEPPPPPRRKIVNEPSREMVMEFYCYFLGTHVCSVCSWIICWIMCSRGWKVFSTSVVGKGPIYVSTNRD